MGTYSSYYYYKKYVKYGDQDPIPVIPEEYSENGDGTLPYLPKSENDPDCGYTGETTGDTTIYRWVNMPISEGYVCAGTSKYYKQKRQFSTDSGATWSDVTPPQYQTGNLYETNSEDCGYTPITGGTKATIGYRYNYSPYGSATAVIPCNGDMTLTYDEVHKNYFLITAATIGECVDTLNMSFNNNAIDSITIPSNIVNIGYQAFTAVENIVDTSYNRKGLGEIVFEEPINLTNIGYQAFAYNDRLHSIALPNSLKTIEPYAFQKSGLSSVTIPDSVETVGGSLFVDCSGLTTAVIGTGLTELASGSTSFWNGCMFQNCTSLHTVTFKSPSSVEIISDQTFAGCTSLSNISLPNSVKRIKNGAFSGCTALTNITIPSSVTEINHYAFGGCTSLTNFVVPTSVSQLGGGIWSGCTSLASITFLEITPFSDISGAQRLFGGIPSTTIAYFTPELYDWAMAVYNNGAMQGRIRMIGS